MITLADGQLILSSFNSQDWTDVDKIRYLIKSATVKVACLNRLIISPGASQWNGSLITQMGKKHISACLFCVFCLSNFKTSSHLHCIFNHHQLVLLVFVNIFIYFKLRIYPYDIISPLLNKVIVNPVYVLNLSKVFIQLNVASRI